MSLMMDGGNDFILSIPDTAAYVLHDSQRKDSRNTPFGKMPVKAFLGLVCRGVLQYTPG